MFGRTAPPPLPPPGATAGWPPGRLQRPATIQLSCGCVTAAFSLADWGLAAWRASAPFWSTLAERLEAP